MTPPVFIIGIDAQPTINFAAWKAIGVNTLVRYDSGPQKNVTIPQWTAAADALGLAYIFTPDAPATEIKSPGLISFHLADEPEFIASEQPPQLVALAQSWKSIGPVLTSVNMNGWNFSNGTTPLYQAYAPCCDAVSLDRYVCNKGYSGATSPGVNLDWTAQDVDYLRNAMPGKRYGAYIECSYQQLFNPKTVTGTNANQRGPTPAEMSVQLWLSVIHGATEIIYFPQQIGYGSGGPAFSYDATTAPMKTEMQKDNGLLNQYGTMFVNGTRSVQTTPTGIESATWTDADGNGVTAVVNKTGSAISYLGASVPAMSYQLTASSSLAMLLAAANATIAKQTQTIQTLQSAINQAQTILSATTQPSH